MTTVRETKLDSKKPMTIRILSFDFDGCLQRPGIRDIVKDNIKLLDAIKEDNKNYTSTHTFIGSARQSFEIDYAIAFYNKNGSCFEAISEVATYLESTFENYLLADLYGDLEPGKSYDRACNTNTPSLSRKIHTATRILLDIAEKNPQLPPTAFGLPPDSKIDLESIQENVSSRIDTPHIPHFPHIKDDVLDPLNKSLKQAGWVSESC